MAIPGIGGTENEDKYAGTCNTASCIPALCQRLILYVPADPERTLLQFIPDSRAHYQPGHHHDQQQALQGISDCINHGRQQPSGASLEIRVGSNTVGKIRRITIISGDKVSARRVGHKVIVPELAQRANVGIKVRAECSRGDKASSAPVTLLVDRRRGDQHRDGSARHIARLIGTGKSDRSVAR